MKRRRAGHTDGPFSVLEDLVRQGRIRLSEPREKAVERVPSRIVQRAEAGGLSDDELFEAAMADVQPLGWSRTPHLPAAPVHIPASDGEEQALRALAEFCRKGRVEVEHTREYVEHSSGAEGSLYLDDLKAGRFALQAHLDLHGLTVSSARAAVEGFIREAVRAGYSCVRVVHGRGRHSPEGRSPMKERVERWLRERRVGRYVMAYTSARLVDGGGGAVYVLLFPARRHKGG